MNKQYNALFSIAVLGLGLGVLYSTSTVNVQVVAARIDLSPKNINTGVLIPGDVATYALNFTNPSSISLNVSYSTNSIANISGLLLFKNGTRWLPGVFTVIKSKQTLQTTLEVSVGYVTSDTNTSVTISPIFKRLSK
jgi:hypothetical protein